MNIRLAGCRAKSERYASSTPSLASRVYAPNLTFTNPSPKSRRISNDGAVVLVGVDRGKVGRDNNIHLSRLVEAIFVIP